MIVVADTSPINYLVSINQIAVLTNLYGTVIIPQAVRDELSRDRAPEIVQRWIASPPGWLEVRRPTMEPDAELIAAELDAGEFDAILLAQELGASELILDDMDGRKEAERRHIHFVGTIGILQAAAKRKLLNLKNALTSLRATNFYIAQELIDRLLAEANQ
jgi:predicted nucleic acid-binding protein